MSASKVAAAADRDVSVESGVVEVGESVSWTIGTILSGHAAASNSSQNKARQDGEVLFERGELQLSSVIRRD